MTEIKTEVELEAAKLEIQKIELETEKTKKETLQIQTGILLGKITLHMFFFGSLSYCVAALI